MHPDFLKPYDHSQEKDIYTSWEKAGCFKPSAVEKTESFCIIMPPPNANGSLHVGHAVGMTLEDLMSRYWRMKGKKVLWLPGADHAGFETQVVFEKKLEKEGTSRFEILQRENGRQELYDQIWNFTQENKTHMEDQIRELGSSCDWSKKTFTLDEKVVDVVYETFEKLYNEGLIYRDKRIVNWCVKHQTSLSDLEVGWEERKDKLYFVRYMSAKDPGKHILVATTRPETIPGDSAVAVHPQDERYREWIGAEVIEPLTGKTIPVVGDEVVEREFGTGALKITPAHDGVDFEVGKRHNLPTNETLDRFGKFTELAGPLAGLKVGPARELAEKLLQEKGVLEKTEEYAHQVGVCYKCKGTIEPMILPQWFVDLTKKGRERIVQPAIDAVTSGKIQIVPDFQKKIFLHWMENIRDWNISRQIVWGIPIPAWFRGDEIKVGKEKPEGEGWMPDPDVFDTWFSSGQWPFATLRAHGIEGEFYPTTVMETAYDILFFWVARMIMLGLYATGKVPFTTVYLHGLVRDKDKQKMSKSKGNVIDPLGIVHQYGADALRMALIVGNSPGQDTSISEEKIKGYRNFSNKLWNIARFVQTRTLEKKYLEEDLNEEDKKIYRECLETKAKVGEEIEKYRFSQAAETAYHYAWHEFADKILEDRKKVRVEGSLEINEENLQGGYIDSVQDKSSRALLSLILDQTLIMLHPFIPFVTEGIYRKMNGEEKKYLMNADWES